MYKPLWQLIQAQDRVLFPMTKLLLKWHNHSLQLSWLVPIIGLSQRTSPDLLLIACTKCLSLDTHTPLSIFPYFLSTEEAQSSKNKQTTCWLLNWTSLGKSQLLPHRILQRKRRHHWIPTRKYWVYLLLSRLLWSLRLPGMEIKLPIQTVNWPWWCKYSIAILPLCKQRCILFMMLQFVQLLSVFIYKQTNKNNLLVTVDCRGHFPSLDPFT